MEKYTEEQFLYFTNIVEKLGTINDKDDMEKYWDEYKKLQDWLLEQRLNTDFISWVEKRVNSINPGI
ncbi:hypothetical protein [Bacillus cereus]|uniref:hypothetical protein n=1 Tax=Bacillus cereus TaxID=1396 RepID=UPI00027C082C|nr:hypothetical protein [Bacillus cereus]EJV54869.1 hypothetical protein IEM_05816 [Bacillus cereus BAG6O-2]